MFIETICSDAIVEQNIRAVKLASADVSFIYSRYQGVICTQLQTQYRDWEPEKAIKDYWNRIQTQAKAYEPIENPSFPLAETLVLFVEARS